MASGLRGGAGFLETMTWLFITMLVLGATLAHARPDPNNTDGSLVSWNMAKQCTYTVITHTGNIEGAGTDADVNVEFFNKKGESVLFVDLSTGTDNFAKGQTDTFTMVGVCVPNICKMHLSHDNSGVDPSWFVNYVSVSLEYQTHVFNVYEWLAKDEPPFSLSFIGSHC